MSSQPSPVPEILPNLQELLQQAGLNIGLSVVHEVEELQQGGARHPSHVEDGWLEGGRGL